MVARQAILAASGLPTRGIRKEYFRFGVMAVYVCYYVRRACECGYNNAGSAQDTRAERELVCVKGGVVDW